jgi:TolB-like protein
VFELDPNRVVVVPFQNHTGDPSLDALAALATRVVAENLAGVAQGIETATPSTRRGGAITGRSEVRRIANEFHAGIVITGRIESEGDEIHFRAELHSLHNGDRRTASLTRSGAGHSVWPIGPVAARTDSPARALHEVRERVNGGVAAWMDPAFSPWLGLALATPRSTFWTGRSVPMVRTPPIAPSNEPPNCRPLSCPLLHSVHTSRTGRTRPGPH